MTTYVYTGPDGEGIAALPDGVGAALGSDYCVHLLPGKEALEKAVAAARDRGIPLLLLMPYFRDAELKAAVALLRAIPKEADVEVAVNDWGLLLAARALFPGMRLSVGRLLSGQKRCPRIGISPRLTPEGRSWHGEGLSSSERARDVLRREFGVTGYHIDAVPWGSPPPVAGGSEDESIRLFVHGPYAVVTVSDACPWIGGVSSSAVPSCSRPCRDGAVRLREPSMGRELFQRGKARFIRLSSPPSGARVAGLVLYKDVP